MSITSDCHDDNPCTLDICGDGTCSNPETATGLVPRPGGQFPRATGGRHVKMSHPAACTLRDTSRTTHLTPREVIAAMKAQEWKL